MFSAVSKFFRSAAVSCPTLPAASVMVWIASKYASNWGTGAPVGVDEVFLLDAGHPHARDAVRLLRELEVGQRPGRGVDERDDVGHLRLAVPLARHAAVQVHHDRDDAEAVDVAVDLDHCRPSWRALSTQTVWSGRYRVAWVGVPGSESARRRSGPPRSRPR
jgi:hypothetical protein